MLMFVNYVKFLNSKEILQQCVSDYNGVQWVLPLTDAHFERSVMVFCRFQNS